MPTRLESGQHQVDVAQVTGASLTTLKEWLRRYCVQGPAVLLDRSCRPHDSPRHLASAALTSGRTRCNSAELQKSSAYHIQTITIV